MEEALTRRRYDMVKEAYMLPHMQVYPALATSP